MTSMLRGIGAGSFCSRSCRYHHQRGVLATSNAGMSGRRPENCRRCASGHHAGHRCTTILMASEEQLERLSPEGMVPPLSDRSVERTS